MRPPRPARYELGRLYVAPSAPLPLITDCRWCGEDLRVRRGLAAYCPTCDPHVAAIANPPTEGTTA